MGFGGKQGFPQEDLGTLLNVVQKKLPANFSTSSLTLVDVTGLSLSITTGSGLLLVFAEIGFDNSLANTGNRFVISVDGVDSDSVDQESNVVGLGKTVFTFSIYAVSPGVHTIKVRALVSGGTLTVIAPTAPAQATHLVALEFRGPYTIS